MRNMFPKKRNDTFSQVLPFRNLIPITMLVIATRILLEIHISAGKKFLQPIENLLIFLYKLHVEFRFYENTPLSPLCVMRVTNINGKTSFSINKTKNVFWMHNFGIEWTLLRPPADTIVQLTSDAA